ncbi:MAG: hypothetical protein R2745_04400 [Vicinamibacterales bacterium]
MLTLSYRTLGALVAAAVVAGWLSASVATPPPVASQELPGRRTPAAATVATIPALALDMAGRPTPRPSGSRNPFAFGGARGSVAASAATVSADSAAPVDATVPAPAVSPAPRWSLVGMATDAAARLTAVLAGASGVHLVTLGDRLPDGAEVTGIAAGQITLRTPDGETYVLRLP